MITYANDVTWLEASLSLGWEPADDDNVEDADDDDDGDDDDDADDDDDNAQRVAGSPY